MISNKYWGKKFGSEAVKATISIANDKLGLYRVEAAVNSKNKRSISLLQKLNFQRIGKSPSHFNINGIKRDLLLYVKT